MDEHGYLPRMDGLKEIAMKKLFVCLLATLITLVSRADSSVTISNQVVLVSGQAILPSTNKYINLAVLWPQYSYDIYLVTMMGWGLPAPFNGTRPTFAAGHGFIAKANTITTLPLAEPTSLILPLALPAGFSIICCQSNVPATFEMMVGRAPDEGTKIFRLLTNNDTFTVPTVENHTNYTVYTFAEGSWNPEPPVVKVGEAVWIFQPPVISNLQVTNGAITFGALTGWGWGTGTEVLWADSLTGTWQTLTNFSYASGSISNVVDPIAPDAPATRFYRLKMPETSP